MADAIPPPPPKDDLDEMGPDDLMREAIREMRQQRRRLEDGDRLFREIKADLTICLRGVQTLLLEKATDRQLVQSLADVTTTLERLGTEQRETQPPPDEITEVAVPVPVRDTEPSPTQPEGQ